MAQQGLRMVLAFAFLMVVQFLALTSAQPECGNQAGGAKCPLSLCCNRDGYCGGTADDCVSNCQSNCKGGVRATSGTAYPYGKYTPSACYGDEETHFPENLLMAKVGDELWNDGKNCGKDLDLRCMDVWCRTFELVSVKIVDHCLNCYNGIDLLLSEGTVDTIYRYRNKPFMVLYDLESSDNAKEAVPWAEQELIIAEVGQIGHT